MQQQRAFRYEEIAGVLRDRLARGDYAASRRLPSERALTGEFGVQRNTVRRALELLEGERRIVRDAARGTFVAPSSVASGGAEETGGLSAGVSARSVLLGVRRVDNSTAPSAVMRGLAHTLGASGYPVLWHDTGGEVENGGDPLPLPVELLLTRSLAGAVVWAEMPAPVARLRRLRDAVPLVLVDRRVPGFESDFVGFDDYAGGHAVTEHLLRLGHRRIGFLSGEPEAATVQGRARGYAAALAAAGILVHPSRVLHQHGGVNLIPESALDAYLEADGEPLTAVVCANDLIAALLIRHLRARGRRVPEDVAVTGFGNVLPEVMDAFGVTTVAQPFEEVGNLAGEILLSRLTRLARGGSGRTGHEIREVELPMELIVRQTCGAHLGPRNT